MYYCFLITLIISIDLGHMNVIYVDIACQTFNITSFNKNIFYETA